ncbi:methyltransferase domain-containing protein [Ktedonobacter sp. SOSP1-85]|uniref:methyltransferase domain-containing protein n=1 Tax=Ktedonobacter sp. SOSP1-85 TaxID=2778367 RepID=UPI0019159C4D|nr:methyltransferase domain-containing protein [Ktedonobacter sp. SOSP1-85]
MAGNNLIHVNDYGLPLNAIEWLETHHQSKASERIHMIQEIALPQGGFIVDAGCGPGLWTPMLAKAVGPEGRILGVDISDESLHVAHQRSIGAWYEDQVEYRRADLEQLPIELNTADIIFSANVSQYFPSPVNTFAAMRPYLKHGGRLIVKDIDFGTMRFGVLSQALQKRVLHARQKWEEKRAALGYAHEDSWIGSKLQHYLRKAGYDAVVEHAYPIRRHSPLTPEYRSYLQGIAEWFLCEGAPFLSAAEKAQWRRSFFSEKNCIFDHPDFFCEEVEYVVSGVRNIQKETLFDEQARTQIDAHLHTFVFEPGSLTPSLSR